MASLVRIPQVRVNTTSILWEDIVGVVGVGEDVGVVDVVDVDVKDI